MLEFRILGPLEVVGEDGSIQLGGPKQRATLAILLLTANRVVSVDELADGLYAGAPPTTAVTQVQRQISELRKVLGASLIATRPPGYVLCLSPDQLDLHRFERLTEEGVDALRRGDAEAAAGLLRDALGLFRGAPLADLTYEAFAQPAVARLEEMRLAALEQRIEAELALRRHADLVGELEELVREQPCNEGFHAQLMRALYRVGRQADALEVFRNARTMLVEEFGIEPSRPLRELERAILGQDPRLGAPETGALSERLAEKPRSLLAVGSDARRLELLVSVVEPLAQLPGRELIVAQLVEDEAELQAAADAGTSLRASLEVPARAAAFISEDWVGDVLRLAATYDAELVLVDVPAALEGDLPLELVALLERSPADVALLAGSATVLAARPGAVCVPFAGSEHDWAALELAALLALASEAQLKLLGTRSERESGRRDASRLLADASLAVQRIVGVETQPLLAEPTEEALVAAAATVDLVVMGISPQWRRQGIGAARRALVHAARAPVLLLHAGPRPSGLAPPGSRTRFTWSVAAGRPRAYEDRQRAPRSTP
jgi:DNA-binding SARP family transcriptional activator